MLITKNKVFSGLLALVMLLSACGQTAETQPATTAPVPTETTATTEPPTTAETLPPPPANPYEPEDFVLVDGYLTCTATPTMLGIDVSYWQQDVNWQQVKAAGIEFAMIRIGWRGSEQGILAEDDFVHQNFRGATDAGLQVGGYFFSQAITVEEAIEEAEYALSIIAGYDVQMPIVYDWEYISWDSRTGNLSPRMLTECTKAFCDTIRAAGYEPMIYFNEDQSHKQMYLEELTDYKFWLAKYDTTLEYPYAIHMWQYTCEGTVPGISGHVDLNLYFPEA